jgi:hypothetical protein
MRYWMYSAEPATKIKGKMNPTKKHFKRQGKEGFPYPSLGVAFSRFSFALSSKVFF